MAGAVEALHARVTALAAARGDASDQLFPVHLAAGVLFADGSTALGREDKALEWGCSLEAPLQLAPAIAGAAARGVSPLVLLVADHAGVAHAPSARARAWLAERGHGGCTVYAHGRDGSLHRTTVARLAPAVPRIQLGGR